MEKRLTLDIWVPYCYTL